MATALGLLCGRAMAGAVGVSRGVSSWIHGSWVMLVGMVGATCRRDRRGLMLGEVMICGMGFVR